jgi:hypothetical protein
MPIWGPDRTPIDSKNVDRLVAMGIFIEPSDTPVDDYEQLCKNISMRPGIGE